MKNNPNLNPSRYLLIDLATQRVIAEAAQPQALRARRRAVISRHPSLTLTLAVVKAVAL